MFTSIVLLVGATLIEELPTFDSYPVARYSASMKTVPTVQGWTYYNDNVDSPPTNDYYVPYIRQSGYIQPGQYTTWQDFYFLDVSKSGVSNRRMWKQWNKDFSFDYPFEIEVQIQLVSAISTASLLDPTKRQLSFSFAAIDNASRFIALDLGSHGQFTAGINGIYQGEQVPSGSGFLGFGTNAPSAPFWAGSASYTQSQGSPQGFHVYKLTYVPQDDSLSGVMSLWLDNHLRATQVVTPRVHSLSPPCQVWFGNGSTGYNLAQTSRLVSVTYTGHRPITPVGGGSEETPPPSGG